MVVFPANSLLSSKLVANLYYTAWAAACQRGRRAGPALRPQTAFSPFAAGVRSEEGRRADKTASAYCARGWVTDRQQIAP